MIKALLLIFIILGFLLRTIQLENYPPGVTGDEIGQAYSAYSILKTGKDEWGDLLPLNPRGFGDYKPALFAYLLIPSIAIFDLNIFATRLPSALFGTLAILGIFLLVREMLKNNLIALLAAIFLSISFWHIQYSRLAWESNIGATLLIFATYFLLKGLNKSIYLIPSSLLFGLTMYSYHSFKVVAILLLVTYSVIFRKELLKANRKYLCAAVLIFGLFFSVLIYSFLFTGAGKRAADAAIYNQENLVVLRETQVKDSLPNPLNRIVNNRIQFIATEFSQNYFGYFSSTFLVSPHRSNSTLFNISGRWLITFWEFLLVIFATYLIIRQKPNWLKIILPLALISPIPAALTRDYMHSQRSEMLLFLIPILSAFALFNFNKILPQKTLKVFSIFFVALISWTFIINMDFYLFHQFRGDHGGIKYGYQEIVKFTEENKDKYSQIIFTKNNSEPQAFVAFYSKMNPLEYQKYSADWKYFEEQNFKFLDMINYKLGKYYFRGIDWSKDKNLENTLIVATPSEVPKEAVPIFSTKDFSGKETFVVFDTNLLKQ